MRISELIAYIVKLPLRREIKHASYSRRDSANLLVRCRLADGTEGWGEGVPRSYVTGETPDGALEQLSRTPLAEQLHGDCTGWPDVLRLCEAFQPPLADGDQRGCTANALRCAVELSVLDAFGKVFGDSLSEVTRQFAPAEPLRTTKDVVQYSTGIMSENPRKEWFSALKMRVYGFAQCKVKVGVKGADDVARLRTIRKWLGRRMDVRVDANEAWSPTDAVSRIEELLPFKITCVEQPVPHEEVDAVAEVRKQVAVPMMLDESFTSLYDARRAIERGTCDVFNIRLSKCGGFLNCLRLAALVEDAGLRFALGCHPGESGILSAAGRHWAASVANIRYLEGSYERHLLRELLTNEDITFGYGGRAPALAGPGLGVTVKEPVLKRLQIDEKTFQVDQ